ncbi:hypothetical protein ACIQYW_27165 [Rhodococcus erythropolis]|nr:hypothetical protein [Rhodococcus sp. (in: high G+C Gram-positive bacteria)]MBJ7478839.1 hypothetical protein [Rhodococcus sp. (in: high G+C Gram-positive bacteria)]
MLSYARTELTRLSTLLVFYRYLGRMSDGPYATAAHTGKALANRVWL